jgi:hypothetical protein
VVKSLFLVGWGRGRLLVTAWALGVAAGCYDVKTVGLGIDALPNTHGRVDVSELDVHGKWFSYGDNYDYPQSCSQLGMHQDELCSVVAWPEALPSFDFPNQNGKMCTFGRVGEAVPCGPDALNCAATVDYSNMWGAGIGLDFHLDSGPEEASATRDPLTREAWDAHLHHVKGVAFDFELLDDGDRGGPWLRVEFPVVLPEGTKLPPNKGSAGLARGDRFVARGDVNSPEVDFPESSNTPSEEYPDGSPYWGAPKVFSGRPEENNSPVRVGHNEIPFSEVNGAPVDDPNEPNIPFDPTRLLGIQFHVPSFAARDAVNGGHFGYGFCISNLTFLRE